jgi:hypothetical protein
MADKKLYLDLRSISQTKDREKGELYRDVVTKVVSVLETVETISGDHRIVVLKAEVALHKMNLCQMAAWKPKATAACTEDKLALEPPESATLEVTTEQHDTIRRDTEKKRLPDDDDIVAKTSKRRNYGGIKGLWDKNSDRRKRLKEAITSISREQCTLSSSPPPTEVPVLQPYIESPEARRRREKEAEETAKQLEPIRKHEGNHEDPEPKRIKVDDAPCRGG